MFCGKCGAELDNDTNFCSRCGVRVSIDEHKKEIRRMNNKCDSCGAILKQLNMVQYLCEYCGSEYLTNNNNEILETKITEKELLDVFYQAASYAVKDKYWEELQCLLGVIDKAPENVMLLVKLGRAYRRNNMHAKAAECYEKSIQINPAYANAYTNLGAVYILAGEFVKAEQYCKNAVDLMNANRIDYTNSDYAVAYSNYAVAVGKLGRKDDAKQLLKIAEDNGYKNGDSVRKMIGIRRGFFF